MVTPGRYQCSVTGLRWENSSTAELEYCLGDWDHFSEFLEKEGFIPCGPLMDIKVISGELAAVHLPHVLCLSFHQWSEVRVLREENTGVSSEICEVSRFHALLPNPTFMPNGVLVRCGFPVKAHCDVLIYLTSAAHLTLHVYLVPWDLKMKESVEKREKGSVKISRSGTDVPLQMKKHYIISTSCFSEITPRKLKLRYTSKTPNFFEVYIEDRKNIFHLHLLTEEKKRVWTHCIQPDKINRNPRDVDGCRRSSTSSGVPRICHSCSSVKDSTDWVVILPEAVALSANEDRKYRITAAPGSYECGVTGVRWKSSCEVELEYYWSNWDLVSEVLERDQYHPCGPLLDITVISGRLEAVHLPHFLCLGSEWLLGDAVRVCHVTDEGVSLERCILTRFHATLLHPTFSPKGDVLKNGSQVKAHCEILIYRVLAEPLTLHLYLIPDDSRMKEAVKKQESGNCVISKPNPESSLQMDNWFKLKTMQNNKTSDYDSEITPERLQLRYTTGTPNFFEVYVNNPTEDFYLQMLTEDNNEIWEVKIRKADYLDLNEILERTRCEILIYCMLAAPQTLHIYLIPHNLKMREAVEKQESGKCVMISKPNPESLLQMKDWFKLKTMQNNKTSDYDSEITPKRLQLRYSTRTPNFFEVYINNPTEEFYLQMLTEDNNVVWEVKIRKGDFSQVSRPEAAWFEDKHINQLIQRIPLVTPYADDLRSLIGQEKYSIITSQSTSQDQMRELLRFVSAGQTLKRRFYESLQKHDPDLFQELQKQGGS